MFQSRRVVDVYIIIILRTIVSITFHTLHSLLIDKINFSSNFYRRKQLKLISTYKITV